jgi:putative DNA primase/helicase
LGTPAGPVDLATGKLLAPDPAHMISRITSVAPAAEPMPYWDKVVGRITRGDSSLLGYVQRWCGFMLTGGENIHEAFLFVVGAGSSGKSKFITTLEDIAGGYFRKIDKEVFTHSGDKNVNIGEKIARLQGARLVTCSELEEGSRWRESLLKDFTGRERVEGRALYQATTEFKPSFRLIFSGNFKPALRSTGEEIRRRLHLLEFPGIIPEEERILDLPDKLRIEHPAILAWMIEGALMLKDAGLGKPEQILDSTAEYLSEEDTLAAWFMACCVADAEASTQSGAAYKSFVAWAKENGEHFIPSAKRFSQKLRDRGHAIKRTSLGSQISGFTLTVNAAPTPSYADV